MSNYWGRLLEFPLTFPEEEGTNSVLAKLRLSGGDDLTSLLGLSGDICRLGQMGDRHMDVACSMVVTGHPPLLLEGLVSS